MHAPAANSIVDEMISSLLSELAEGLSEGMAGRIVIALIHSLDKHGGADWDQLARDWPHEWVRDAFLQAGAIA